jgi:serine O-acetyltransferase
MHQTNPQQGSKLATLDPIWDRIRHEAEEIVRREPELATFIYSTVLHHGRLEDSVVHRVADRLDHSALSGDLIRQTFDDALRDEPDLGHAFRADLVAVYDRDPATTRFIDPLLYFKGFHALQTHRLAHWLYRKSRKDFAFYLQSRSSAVFQTDINPAARIGRGIFLDHATGFVCGETAIIEDNVSILHGVTLGGTGKENEDRHPKIRHGVLIGAGDGRYLAWGGLVVLAVFAPLALAAVHRHPQPDPGLAWLWLAFGVGFMTSRAAVLVHRARGSAWLVTGA